MTRELIDERVKLTKELRALVRNPERTKQIERRLEEIEGELRDND